MANQPTPSDTPARDRLANYFGAAAVVLAVLVLVLGIQNRRLKSQIAAMQPPPPPEIEAGARLDPIQLIDVDGRVVPMSEALGGRRAMVLMFTPTCPACRETLPVWAELARSLEPGALPIFGVNLAPADPSGAESWIDAGLPFPVYRVEATASPGVARITHVPATILFDAGGAVERSWFGQLDDAWAAEMRRFLGG